MTKNFWVGDSGAGLDYDDNPAKTAAPNDPGSVASSRVDSYHGSPSVDGSTHLTTELDRSFPFMGDVKPSKIQNLSVTPKLKLKYHGGRVRRLCDKMVLDTEQTAPGLLSSNLESCQGCFLYRKVTSNASHKSISSSRGPNPVETCSVKSSKPFREENFNACEASISFGWILFRRGVTRFLARREETFARK